MAYMNQSKKAIIQAALDKVLKPRGIKYITGARSYEHYLHHNGGAYRFSWQFQRYNAPRV